MEDFAQLVNYIYLYKDIIYIAIKKARYCQDERQMYDGWEVDFYKFRKAHLREVAENLGDIIGEGNGTPLQYSCLENPVDGGAW